MERTFPFWPGVTILVVPAATMILAVLDALPGWVPVALSVVLFALPIPAGASLIADGVRAWRERRPLAAGFELVGGLAVLLAILGFLLVFGVELVGRMAP